MYNMRIKIGSYKISIRSRSALAVYNAIILLSGEIVKWFFRIFFDLSIFT